MKTLTFALFFFLGLSSLEAQSQPGSVAIADAIKPSTETMVSDFTNCVKDLVPLVEAKEAITSCKEVTKTLSNTLTRGFNESADATKASRPMVIATGRYGGGWSSSYYRGGWNSGRRVIIASDRSERNANLQRAREERNTALHQAREKRNANLQRAREERVVTLRNARSVRH